MIHPAAFRSTPHSCQALLTGSAKLSCQQPRYLHYLYNVPKLLLLHHIPQYVHLVVHCCIVSVSPSRMSCLQQHAPSKSCRRAAKSSAFQRYNVFYTNADAEDFPQSHSDKNLKEPRKTEPVHGQGLQASFLQNQILKRSVQPAGRRPGNSSIALKIATRYEDLIRL